MNTSSITNLYYSSYYNPPLSFSLSDKPSSFAPIQGPKFSVELKPMEIRTFQVTITQIHK